MAEGAEISEDAPGADESLPAAARAASVVHEFTKAGIDPLRLEIVGFGEFHPRQPNTSVEGRNANRRVAILVLEAVAPGGSTTLQANEHAPESAAPALAPAGPTAATVREVVP